MMSDQDSASTGVGVRRFIHLLFVVGILAGFSFHLYRQFDKYLYDPVVDVRSSSLNRTTFPDVTVCFPLFYWKMAEFANQAAPNVKCFAGVFEKHLRKLWQLVLFNTTSESSLTDAQQTADQRPAKLSMYGLLVNSVCGVRLYDMLAYCRYQGAFCNFRNFTSYFDDDRGFCYHLSPQDPVYRGSDAASGLVLSLTSNGESVDPNGYYPGYLIFLHTRNTWPNVGNLDGSIQYYTHWFFDFSHNTLSRVNRVRAPCVARKKLRLCRLETPGGIQCRDYWETESVNQLVAQQRILAERCNCITLAWPIPEDLLNKSACFHVPEEAAIHRGLSVVDGEVMVKPLNTSAPDVPLRTLVDLPLLKKRHECHKNALRVISATIIPKLKENCFEDTYSVAKQNFESLNHQLKDVKKVKDAMGKDYVAEFEKNRPLINASNPKSIFANPMWKGMTTSPKYLFEIAGVYQARINVFSQRPTVNNEQYVVYTVLYFLADVGGVTGLWIGMSIVTIFEMAQWTLKRVKRSCKKK